jgi:hypothetical protein
MVFGLVIAFIIFFDTARDHTLQYSLIHMHTLMPHSHVLTVVAR